MTIKTVGVIGAGVMGRGVAQNLAQTDHDVVLVDIDDAILKAARSEIRNNIRLQGLFNKAAKPAGNALDKIQFTTDYQLLANADFVVENAVEKWDIKKEIYPQLDAICPEPCVFAANTSAISITKIASATNRPDRVVGMHFMNPVPMKDTVEVIRGFHSSDKSMDTARQFLSQMGKEGVVVKDSPGFVSNRVLMLTVNEAIFLLQDQVASVEDVDKIFRDCFGHKMGPLETADLIGLDTILYSIEVLYESFNDSKFRPCPLLKKMVDAGLYGRKNGRGFYNYKTPAS
ncbi:MAG: 3-hydroxybutyryl-CoA dehydrogenase [Candidatus Latescibacterota bacterium]|jgi:3-hydroxybutyryl-CoA dehydrogenase